jgi:hypothetical protein
MSAAKFGPAAAEAASWPKRWTMAAPVAWTSAVGMKPSAQHGRTFAPSSSVPCRYQKRNRDSENAIAVTATGHGYRGRNGAGAPWDGAPAPGFPAVLAYSPVNCEREGGKPTEGCRPTTKMWRWAAAHRGATVQRIAISGDRAAAMLTSPEGFDVQMVQLRRTATGELLIDELGEGGLPAELRRKLGPPGA